MTSAEGRRPARVGGRGDALTAGAGTTLLLVAAALLAIGLPALLWQHWDGVAHPEARGSVQVRPTRADKTGRTAKQQGKKNSGPAMGLAYTDARGRELGRVAVAAVQDPFRGAGDPPKGERYVLLTMQIENTGDDDLPVRPEGFVLRDASGFTYAPIPAAQAAPAAAAEATDATKERKPKGNDRKAAASPAAGAAGTPERKARRGAEAAATPDRGEDRKAAKQDGAKQADAEPAAEITPLRAAPLAPGGVARGDLLFAAPADAVLTNLLYVPDQSRLLIVATLGTTSQAQAKATGGKAGGAEGAPNAQQ